MTSVSIDGCALPGLSMQSRVPPAGSHHSGLTVARVADSEHWLNIPFHQTFLKTRTFSLTAVKQNSSFEFELNRRRHTMIVVQLNIYLSGAAGTGGAAVRSVRCSVSAIQHLPHHNFPK